MRGTAPSARAGTAPLAWRLGLLLFAACAAPAAASGLAAEGRQAVTILSPAALETLGISSPTQAGQALDKPFDDAIELTLMSRVGAAAGTEPVRDSRADPVRETPAHCRALLAAEPLITGTPAASDWPVLRRRLADCHALRWLAQAVAPVHSALPERLLELRSTHRWPAVLWPAVAPDEQEAATLAGQTLRTSSRLQRWYPQASAGAGAGDSWQLSGQGYTVRVQWLARADFDGDGWEDLLLRWQAQATGGSWRDVRTVLLTRRTQDRLSVVAEPPRR